VKRWWDQVSNFFSAAVVVAIAIFLTREILEALRRRAANIRKLRAIRTLLAAEIERNNFTLTTLADIANEADAALKNKGHVSIDREGDGRLRIKVDRSDGSRSWPVPTVHNAALGQYLLELALLDKILFESALSLSDALAQLEHVRASLVREVMAFTAGRPHNLETFHEYASREIEWAREQLESLYRLCAAKELTTQRVR
jgi:hypothetical protein